MTSPLGEDTEAGGEDGVDDDHLTKKMSSDGILLNLLKPTCT